MRIVEETEQQHLQPPPIHTTPGEEEERQQHHAALHQPGAVRVLGGNGVVDDQSISPASNPCSNADFLVGIVQPLDPLPAYTVHEQDDAQRRAEGLNDIRALRNELHLIGVAVQDIYGRIGNTVEGEITDGTAEQGEITDGAATQPHRPLDDRREGRKHFGRIVALVLVVVFLGAGLTVVLLVIADEQRNDTCFTNRDEILEAVDTFLQGDDVGANSTLAKRYGWPMNEWCVRKIQDFSYLFSTIRIRQAVNFNEDISSWDTSNALDMEGMFLGAAAFDAADLTSWNVSKISNMGYLFKDAVSFNGNISTWNVSNVVSMRGMLRNTPFVGDISTWDVSNVKIMAGMFFNSSFAGNISAWNVSSVYWFGAMFSDSVFNGDISNWDVSGAEIMTSMFQRTPNFNQDLSSWDVSAVIDAPWMFHDARMFNSDVSTWNVSSLTNATMMFSGAVAFKGGNLSGWDVSRATTCRLMFSEAESFNGDISSWNVSKVTDMQQMFYKTQRFNQDLSSWDVSRVVNFYQIFSGVSSFRQDLCPWGEHVRDDADVTQMFTNTACESVDDPDIGAPAEQLGPFCVVCEASKE